MSPENELGSEEGRVVKVYEESSGKRRFGIGSLITTGVLSVAATLGIGYLAFVRPLQSKVSEYTTQNTNLNRFYERVASLEDKSKQFLTRDNLPAVNLDSIPEFADLAYRVANAEDSLLTYKNSLDSLAQHQESSNKILSENFRGLDIRVRDMSNEIGEVRGYIDEKFNDARVYADIRTGVPDSLRDEMYLSIASKMDSLSILANKKTTDFGLIQPTGWPLPMLTENGKFTRDGRVRFNGLLNSRPEVYNLIDDLVEESVISGDYIKDLFVLGRSLESVDSELSKVSHSLFVDYTRTRYRITGSEKHNQTHYEAIQEKAPELLTNQD